MPTDPAAHKAAEVADELALHQLRAATALCNGTCTEPSNAVLAIPEDARNRAAVARHVRDHPDNSVGEALGAGRMVSHEHLMAVHDATQAVAGGADPTTAAGADARHVALIDAAEAAHEPHRAKVEAAYAEYAAASAALAKFSPPSRELPALVGLPEDTPAGGI